MKYKVKSLAVSGLRNKVHKCREIVTDKNFPPGRAEELVKSGHLVPVEEEAKPDAGGSGSGGGSGEATKPLTKKQIMAKLEELGIEFDPKSNKETLQGLLDSPPKKEDEEEDETGAGGSGSLEVLKENLE